MSAGEGIAIVGLAVRFPGADSVEAFWQMSKVIEVRYDRFLALGAGDRDDPIAGL